MKPPCLRPGGVSAVPHVFVMAALAAFGLSSCTDDGTAPGAVPFDGTRQLAIAMDIAGAAQAGPAQAEALNRVFDAIDSVRVTVTEGGLAAPFDTTFTDVTVTEAGIELPAITIEGASSADATFHVVVTAYAAGSVAFSGEGDVQGSDGSGGTTAAPVVVTYSGPGSEASGRVAAAVEITPDGSVVGVEQSRLFAVRVLDAAGDPIEGVFVGWESSSVTTLTVDTAGTATGQAVGVARLAAAIPTGLADTTTAYVLAGKLAFIGGDSTIYTAGIDGSARTSLETTGSTPEWEMDGTKLLASVAGHVTEVTNGTVLTPGFLPTVHPDGTKYIAGTDEGVVVANIDASVQEYETDVVLSDGSWGADGASALVARPGTGIIRYDLRSEDSTVVLADAAVRWLDVAYADGKIAFVKTTEAESRLGVLAAAGGTPAVVTPADLAVVSRPTFSPDGRWIVFAAESEGMDRGLYVVAADGSAPPVRLPLDGWTSDPSWAPNAPYLDPPTLALSTLSPTQPFEGDTLAIRGSGFDWILWGNNEVYFPTATGTIQGEVLDVSDTILVVQVPFGIVDGTLRVTTFTAEATLALDHNPLLEGNVLLQTQADVDALAAEGWAGIGGSLTVRSNPAGAITTLEGLETIQRVNGSVSIEYNGALTSIDGLAGLQEVRGYLYIYQDSALVTMAGFPDLVDVGGGVYIAHNPVLETIGDWSSLQRAAWWEVYYNPALLSLPTMTALSETSGIYIGWNGALESIGDFPVLQHVDYQIDIWGDTLLTSLGQFPVLTTADGIYISDNYALPEIVDRFPVLDSVGGYVGIWDNRSMTTFDDLHALRVVGTLEVDEETGDEYWWGYLDVGYNESLQTFSGLGSLERVEGWLEFYYNPVLSALPALPALTSVREGLYLYDNDAITAIDGLNNLQRVGGWLYVGHNDALQTVTGLTALTDVGWDSLSYNYYYYAGIDVWSNPALTTFDLPVLQRTGYLEFWNDTSLVSIGGLQDLQEIRSNLYVYGNHQLEALPAMAALTRVGGYIYIGNNRSLGVIEGFDALVTLGDSATYYTSPAEPAWGDSYGGIDIYNNPSLSVIRGFSSLTEIQGWLYVDYNPRLEAIETFGQLERLYAGMYVWGNDSLTSMPAFDLLERVGGDLYIWGNRLLPAYPTFAALDTIGNEGDGYPWGALYLGYNDQVVSIDGFTSLTKVFGEVEVYDHSRLQSMDGLGGLREIGGLWVAYNDSLTAMPALASLDSVAGHLRIYSNPELASIPSFANIGTIGYEGTSGSWGNFEVSYNAKLPAISGFDALEKVVGGFRILGNSSLESIPTFPLLADVGYNFDISNNESLLAVTGFEALAAVGSLSNGSFSIGNNDLMTEVSGFGSLTSVPGNLWIGDHLSLGTIAGFGALQTIGGTLFIQNNAALGSTPEFSSLASIGGWLQITSNNQLTTMGSFPLLGTIGGSTAVFGNPRLTAVPGFPELVEIAGYFQFGGDSIQSVGEFPLLAQTGLGGQNFFISGPRLGQIPTFPSLVSVGGSLSLNGLDALPGISGFGALTSVGAVSGSGGLFMNYNDSIASITGFGALTSVAGDLSITSNPLLGSVQAFGSLQSTGGSLDVVSNQSLTTLNAFGGVTGIGGDFFVSGSPGLGALPAMPVLASVGGTLLINGTGVTSLDGFDVLQSVGLDIVLENNDFLPNLVGLETITSSIRDLHIYDNDALQAGGLDPLLNIGDAGALPYMRNVTIYYNYPITDTDVQTWVDTFEAKTTGTEISGTKTLTPNGGTP